MAETLMEYNKTEGILSLQEYTSLIHEIPVFITKCQLVAHPVGW
jgi:hypothetical protein